MIDDHDELGIPKRGRGRPIKIATYRPKPKPKAFKRMRGSWPEAIENMAVGDSKSVSKHFTHEKYSAEDAKEVLARESRAIKKAMNRVRNQNPIVRLRQFKINRFDVPGDQLCHVVTITLTRVS